MAASEFLLNGVVDWGLVHVVSVEVVLEGVGISSSSERGFSFYSIAVFDNSSMLIWNSFFFFI